MTTNQIEYAKLLETRRSNQETESLTRERDTKTHERGMIELGESARHNLATEALTQRQLSEQERSNRAKESISMDTLSETKRANLERERQNLLSLRETRRSNQAKEAENYRSNKARETETHRSNLVSEGELERSHRASESLQAQANSIHAKQVSETIRSNQASEMLRALSQAETVRSNLRQEQLTAVRNRETKRSNKAKETETNRTNLANEGLKQQEVDVKEQVLQETQRHNLATEKQAARSMVVDNATKIIVGGINAGGRMLSSKRPAKKG